MDARKNSGHGGDAQQQAILELEAAFVRARDSFLLDLGGVIANAIEDAARRDPSAGATALYNAQESIGRALKEREWPLRRAWRAFLQAFRP